MTQAVCCVDFRPDNNSKNLLTASPTQGLELEDLLSLRNSFVLVKPSPSYCITAAPYVECEPCESCIFLRSEWRRLRGGFTSLQIFFSSVVVRSLFSPGVRLCAVFCCCCIILDFNWVHSFPVWILGAIIEKQKQNKNKNKRMAPTGSYCSAAPVCLVTSSGKGCTDGTCRLERPSCSCLYREFRMQREVEK